MNWKALLIGFLIGYALLAGIQAITSGAEEGYRGYIPYTPDAPRCEKDLTAMYRFWQANIANTPNPQLTLETGIHINQYGQPEQYDFLLNRIAYYAALHC